MFSQGGDESEEVFFEGRIDPSYIKRSMLTILSQNCCCIILAIMMPLMMFMIPGGSSVPETGIIFIGIGLGLLGLVVFLILYKYLWAKAYVRNFSFQITGTHIIIQSGVFSKRRDSIPFSRIQNISIKAGFFDRMFNLSSVNIETAGSSGGMYRGRGAYGRAGTMARGEGFIPGQKEPELIEKQIREMVKKHGGGGM